MTKTCVHGITPKWNCEACKREYQREWLVKNPNYQREWHKIHKEHHNELQRNWRRQNRIKTHAQKLAKKIALGSKCEKCGSTENLERHHEDYSKPLEVKTLCRKCHNEVS